MPASIVDERAALQAVASIGSHPSLEAWELRSMSLTFTSVARGISISRRLVSPSDPYNPLHSPSSMEEMKASSPHSIAR